MLLPCLQPSRAMARYGHCQTKPRPRHHLRRCSWQSSGGSQFAQLFEPQGQRMDAASYRSAAEDAGPQEPGRNAYPALDGQSQVHGIHSSCRAKPSCTVALFRGYYDYVYYYFCCFYHDVDYYYHYDDEFEGDGHCNEQHRCLDHHNHRHGYRCEQEDTDCDWDGEDEERTTMTVVEHSTGTACIVEIL